MAGATPTYQQMIRAGDLPPNLGDYPQLSADFSWGAARAQYLDGLPDGGLNIAHEAVDRHARSNRADHLAPRWLARDGSVREFSYGELARQSSRFANVLRGLGLVRGERFFVLTGRIPELYVAALGTLKNGNVFCPLFSAFGPEPIEARLSAPWVPVRGEGAFPALRRIEPDPIIDRLHSPRIPRSRIPPHSRPTVATVPRLPGLGMPLPT